MECMGMRRLLEGGYRKLIVSRSLSISCPNIVPELI